MNRALSMAAILLLTGSLYGCAASGAGPVPPIPQAPQEAGGIDSAALDSVESVNPVESVVREFGGRLQTVSLLAPADAVKASLQEQYDGLVSAELLALWQSDPGQAPGRVVSSPWPDRIEVVSTEKLSDSAYRVQGEIIEVTSVEKANGGSAARRPVTLTVERAGDGWLITGFQAGDYETGVLYRNPEYGFTFTLPAAWEGYAVVTTEWEGLPVGGSDPVQTGPMISLRHPLWTAEAPRQDVPIMIFTVDQWGALQEGEFHIGAAPMGPRELGRNTEYVFALPARYNYAFPEGYEEVEEILEGHPLQAVEPRPE